MEKSQPQPSSDLYGIARDSAESERLNRQHKILTTNLGFLLYPGVERQLSDTPKIADLGTGTGIWLLDLAKQRAGSRGLYHGLDVSPDQFPQTPPKNVKFTTLNMLDPVPNNLRGTFDVIHLRLVWVGLPEGTWPRACRNILDLLKPGGYVQWEECDVLNARVIQDLPSTSTKNSKELHKRLVDGLLHHGQGVGELLELESHLTGAGFAKAHTDIISSDRVCTLRAGFNEVLLTATSALTAMISKKDGPQSYWGTEAARMLFQAATAELESAKVYYRTDWLIVTAHKS